MAKMTYLEVVDLLSQKVSGSAKTKLDHVVARKHALKEEDSDLDAILDGILREMQEGK